MQLGKKGARFVTWEWDFDRQGVHAGHYFMENYEAAKLDFAVRAGLINEQRLFSDEQLAVIRNTCEFALEADATLSYAEEKQLHRLHGCGVVPVVVLDDVKDAVATAKALLAGGVDVMEITFRTAAAADSIKAVAESCSDMLVGAGTVITLEQCKKAVECGAKFIVSPGFDEEVVRWCVENGIAVTPGCVTPSEIMAAMKLGLTVVKFFPAGVYGGLSAMKALSGPFGGIKFIPTGGVNGQNIGEFIAAPFIHAVGGSWVCPKADIAAGNFEKITTLCKQARAAIQEVRK